jgi:hypothetical protein
MTTKISQLPANQQIAWAAATPAVTVSTPLLDAQQTWNAGAVTFTGLKLNVTDTASAAGSKLIDLQVASSTVFSVTKAGDLSVTGGVLVGSQGSTASSALGYYSGGLVMGSTARVGWTSGAASATQDVTLFRDAANTLALRNGVSAQTQRWYETFTDSSNGAWFQIQAANGRFELAALANGTGTTRAIHFLTGGGNGTTRWNITASGDLLGSTDLTYNIGAPAATRPLGAYVGFVATLITSQSGTTYSVSTSDSSIVFTAASTVTLTLPAAASFTGRKLHLKTTGGGSVISASSNVVPKAGGAAGTAILGATAGTWAELQSDGTNWIVLSGT